MQKENGENSKGENYYYEKESLKFPIRDSSERKLEEKGGGDE